MCAYRAKLSNEGHTYTPKDGLVGGLHTYAVIQPDSRIHLADNSKTWEAIVIGAGYAGLVAARDLVKAGE